MLMWAILRDGGGSRRDEEGGGEGAIRGFLAGGGNTCESILFHKMEGGASNFPASKF